MTYIALLRGINVGGHHVKMERLRQLFGELGLTNVRTYIQSGNVFFESQETNCAALTKRIETHLSKELGYAVPVFLRTPAELETALTLEAFKAVEATPNTRLLIVFTREAPTAEIIYPHRSVAGDLEIVRTQGTEIFVVMRVVNGRFGDLERFLRDTYKNKLIVTTRFHNTTSKILEAARSNCLG